MSVFKYTSMGIGSLTNRRLCLRGKVSTAIIGLQALAVGLVQNDRQMVVGCIDRSLSCYSNKV